MRVGIKDWASRYQWLAPTSGQGRTVAELMVEPSRSPDPSRAALPQAWVRRAERLRIGAPVAYRSIYDAAWLAGSTVNISRTGVLFRPADGVSPPIADLQLVIYLSRAPLVVDGAQLPTPDLYCGGRIARTADHDSQPLVAMQIDFEWADAPPGRLWETGV